MARILVVDDDKAIQVITKLLLEREGHAVCCAGDGSHALQAFREDSFDLLIIDIFMPGMDGLETMKMVHQQRPQTPIIIISGHCASSRTAAPDFLAMSTKLGATSSLHKPFRSGALLTQVARCLADNGILKPS
jgi:two-component system response regulator (stage 0 sporulation protein F)